MNAIVPINPSLAPALARQHHQEKGKQLANNFAAGVVDSFPVISIKGKIFRFKFQGEEHLHVDANRYPIPYMDIVLVNASPDISKVFYEKGFTEGDISPPDCSSLNGIKPDPASPKLQSPTCGGCRQNVFGSRITPAGKKAKACADSRRIAVAVPGDLGVKDVMPIMLRAPQSSTKGLKEYVLYLERNGFMPNACVTRLSFDPNDAFPKLLYAFAGPLSDAQYAHADKLVSDERTLRILAAPIDTGDIEVNEPGSLATGAAAAPAQYATVGSPPTGPAVTGGGPVTQGVTQPPVDPAYAAFLAQQAAARQAAEQAEQEAQFNREAGEREAARLAALAAAQQVQTPPVDPAYAAWLAQKEAAEKAAAQPQAPPEDPAYAAWKAQQAAEGKAKLDAHNAQVTADAKAKQAAASNGAAPANPFAGLTGGQEPQPGPGWTAPGAPAGTPAFLAGDKSVSGPVIDGTVNPQPVEEPAATRKPRSRPSTPPAQAATAADVPGTALGAPAGLDDLLAGLVNK